MTSPAPMDVTNRFVLDFARRFEQSHPGARILDYGCGAGRLVQAGRAAGLAMEGTDVFYAGSSAREEAAKTGLLGSAIHEMMEGRMPYAANRFDLIVNNQVMEHVEDLDAVLREIHRVLKPGGTVLSLFPAVDVFREGHIGIPFSHWMRKGSRRRFYYTWALRSLGLGTWKEQAPTCRQWALNKLDWIDRFTVYRSRREIFSTYDRYFASTLVEEAYIRYRLLDRPGREWVVNLLRLPGMMPLAKAVFRKLAFLVILSRKESR
ncbi:MAG: methyltransferase domain-containing protein [Bryobacterales bacterium]|nr:methyltransferase domain-containing protein [Bryobacterales bacterium]